MKISEIDRWYFEVYEDTITCTLCGLHKTCLRPVPGHGNLGSKVILIGEAPGEKEDTYCKPFVGPAGRLLNKMLSEAGLERRSFYVTNLVKCRPPGNRTPESYEIGLCDIHLIYELDILKPDILIPLGHTATNHLLENLIEVPREMHKRCSTITQARSRIFGQYTDLNWDGPFYIIIPMFHPSYCLRNKNARSITIQDFKGLNRFLKGEALIDAFGTYRKLEFVTLREYYLL